MIFARLWHRVLGQLEAGEPATWLRESREAVARRTLFAEMARIEAHDRASAYVIELGPGVDQRYGLAVLRYLTEPGTVEPAVPAMLPARRAEMIRVVLDSYVVAHRYRA